MSEPDRSHPIFSCPWAMLAAALVLLVSGLLIGRYTAPGTGDHAHHDGAPGEGGEPTVWTCSMHPQIRDPGPGKCALCGMDLIPAASGSGDDEGPRILTMSREAMKLAEIQTAKVKRKLVDIDIRMVGKVDYDETRVKTIAAWVPGRLDRLFVDYTGVPVRTGDHLVEIYSPDLYAAQEELIQALAAVKRIDKSSSSYVKEATEKTLLASREKLRLLGLGAEQIKAIESRGTPSARIEIRAPVSGIVVHKHAKEGMYVKTGSHIYTVADLSRVWVRLDAYESDLSWIRYGQEVQIKTEAYGDKTFNGWVSFVDPVLNPKTRTVKVRVLVENDKGLLRPNMFARAIVKVQVGANDTVVSPALRGKWISPMHPEVVKDEPGPCDVCGMALVRAEEIGYASAEDATPALVVPATAVLTTGDRAVVYVRVPDRDKPTFQGVEIKIGPRAGNQYIVRKGLEEGQEVVTHGNLKIDSALQLLAKPSMMSMGEEDIDDPEGTEADTPLKRIPLSEAALKRLAPVTLQYLKAQEALAADKEAPARAALSALADVLDKIGTAELEDPALTQWQALSAKLGEALSHLGHHKGIEGARKVFLDISPTVIRIMKTFGQSGASPYHVAFCSMANNNKGAEWLQRNEEINNPYFGSAMLRCGEIRETLEPTLKIPAALHTFLAAAYKEYLGVQEALAADDSKKARAAGEVLAAVVKAGPAGPPVTGPVQKQLHEVRKDLSQAAASFTKAGDIQAQREAFSNLAASIEKALRALGPVPGITVRRAYCSMAFDNKGGHWLQDSETIANPYFGATMLRCGEIKETLSAPAPAHEAPDHDK